MYFQNNLSAEYISYIFMIALFALFTKVFVSFQEVAELNSYSQEILKSSIIYGNLSACIVLLGASLVSGILLVVSILFFLGAQRNYSSYIC